MELFLQEINVILSRMSLIINIRCFSYKKTLIDDDALSQAIGMLAQTNI